MPVQEDAALAGRVSCRTAAGQSLDEGAIIAAAIAAIRHNHTRYDELLTSGSSRLEVRDAVRETVGHVLARWRKPAR